MVQMNLFPRQERDRYREQMYEHHRWKRGAMNLDSVIDIYIYQFSSVTQSCLTLCDPMNCSTPGLPVHHQLPEFTQTHVH